MRLIDADALEKFLKQLQRELPKESRDFFTRDEMILNFQQYVHMQPTIDAVPVVRGEWVVKKHAGDMAIYGDCSECGYEYNQSYFDAKNFKVIRLRGFSFCPNCGAKMESESGT